MKAITLNRIMRMVERDANQGITWNPMLGNTRAMRAALLRYTVLRNCSSESHVDTLSQMQYAPNERQLALDALASMEYGQSAT
jgi:hypothetical protein